MVKYLLIIFCCITVLSLNGLHAATAAEEFRFEALRPAYQTLYTQTHETERLNQENKITAEDLNTCVARDFVLATSGILVTTGDPLNIQATLPAQSYIAFDAPMTDLEKVVHNISIAMGALYRDARQLLDFLDKRRTIHATPSNQENLINCIILIRANNFFYASRGAGIDATLYEQEFEGLDGILNSFSSAPTELNTLDKIFQVVQEGTVFEIMGKAMKSSAKTAPIKAATVSVNDEQDKKPKTPAKAVAKTLPAPHSAAETGSKTTPAKALMKISAKTLPTPHSAASAVASPAAINHAAFIAGAQAHAAALAAKAPKDNDTDWDDAE